MAAKMRGLAHAVLCTPAAYATVPDRPSNLQAFTGAGFSASEMRAISDLPTR